MSKAEWIVTVVLALIGFGLTAGQGFRITPLVLVFWALAGAVAIYGIISRPREEVTALDLGKSISSQPSGALGFTDGSLLANELAAESLTDCPRVVFEITFGVIEYIRFVNVGNRAAKDVRLELGIPRFLLSFHPESIAILAAQQTAERRVWIAEMKNERAQIVCAVRDFVLPGKIVPVFLYFGEIGGIRRFIQDFTLTRQELSGIVNCQLGEFHVLRD